MKFVFLDEVLVVHDKMIEVGGGSSGVRDFALLHSAIERPKVQFGGKYLYSDVFQMGAALLQSLVKNHPFVDGNKRTAYFSTMRFMKKNGFELVATGGKLVDFVVEVDIGNKTIEEISEWLKKYSKKIK